MHRNEVKFQFRYRLGRWRDLALLLGPLFRRYWLVRTRKYPARASCCNLPFVTDSLHLRVGVGEPMRTIEVQRTGHVFSSPFTRIVDRVVLGQFGVILVADLYDCVGHNVANCVVAEAAM